MSNRIIIVSAIASALACSVGPNDERLGTLRDALVGTNVSIGYGIGNETSMAFLPPVSCPPACFDTVVGTFNLQDQLDGPTMGWFWSTDNGASFNECDEAAPNCKFWLSECLSGSVARSIERGDLVKCSAA